MGLNDVVVFTKCACPIGYEATEKLKKSNTKFKELDIAKYPGAVYALTGRETCPAVFVKGKLVGSVKDIPVGGTSITKDKHQSSHAQDSHSRSKSRRAPSRHAVLPPASHRGSDSAQR